MTLSHECMQVDLLEAFRMLPSATVTGNKGVDVQRLEPSALARKNGSDMCVELCEKDRLTIDVWDQGHEI